MSASSPSSSLPVDASIEPAADPVETPSASAGHFLGLFKDHSDDNDYEYLESADPDRLKSFEQPLPANRFVRAALYLTHGRGIPWKWLVLLTLYAAATVTGSHFFAKGWDENRPEKCASHWWCSQLTIDSNVMSYVGFALFLLLGFRVNESYGRYLEGIRIWNDDIAGVTSAFATYVTMAFRRGFWHSGDRERILGLTAAISVCIKRELRGETNIEELKSMLCEADLAEIQQAPDMPGHCIYLLTAYLVEAMYNPPSKMSSFFIVSPFVLGRL